MSEMTLDNMVMIYSEATPNPETMKFVANKMLLPDDSIYFQTRQAALKSPLATALFEFPFVNSVFIMNNFVTIGKLSTYEWPDITATLRDFIKEYLQNGGTILNVEEKTTEGDADEDAVVSRIKELLDLHVKPAVEMDGGAIHFKSFEEGVVTVTLKGSCSGCPSSTITLKAGIENMLKRMVPEVQAVEAEAM